jgi:hypothetical protein
MQACCEILLYILTCKIYNNISQQVIIFHNRRFCSAHTPVASSQDLEKNPASTLAHFVTGSVPLSMQATPFLARRPRATKHASYPALSELAQEK